MARDRESITIDPILNKAIKEEMEKQGRSYSGMIQYMCKQYLKINQIEVKL